MRGYGGFEHNLQSLRVVDELESRYADFPGLNLTFETREGILKHCAKRNARELGEIGQRFLDRTEPGLEAQLADVADAIAYNNHDIDDGYRAGLLAIDQLREQPLFARHFDAVTTRYPRLEDRRLIYETIRRMIDNVVTDLIETTRRNVEASAPATIDDVRRAGRRLVGFSSGIEAEHRALKQFLNAHLYEHDRKLATTKRVQRVLEDLFAHYMSSAPSMPREFAAAAEDAADAGRARVVADYIAGMTDRFALAEHERLTGNGAIPP